jgi:hypothetical protein
MEALPVARIQILRPASSKKFYRLSYFGKLGIGIGTTLYLY